MGTFTHHFDDGSTMEVRTTDHPATEGRAASIQLGLVFTDDKNNGVGNTSKLTPEMRAKQKKVFDTVTEMGWKQSDGGAFMVGNGDFMTSAHYRNSKGLTLETVEDALVTQLGFERLNPVKTAEQQAMAQLRDAIGNNLLTPDARVRLAQVLLQETTAQAAAAGV